MNPELDFDQVEHIQRTVPDLGSLVAVWRQAGHGELRCVVADQGTAEKRRPGVIGIDEWRNLDLSDQTGPLIGFSALDVVRDDILTKGPAFYPIERLFERRGQNEELLRAMWQLAQYLALHLNEWRAADRAASKIVQLALPALLADRDCRRLAAVVPPADLHRIQDVAAWKFFTVDDFVTANADPFASAGVDLDSDWLVAFSELSQLAPVARSNPTHFVELRGPLQQAFKWSDLNSVCVTLAQHCWKLGDPQREGVALALLAERWLTAEWVDDLVAICPHTEFDRYLSDGTALYVYRTEARTEAAAQSDQRPAAMRPISLEQLLREGLPADYGHFILTADAVRNIVRRHFAGELVDLGAVLFRSGYEQAWGRTLWLLSRDLLELQCDRAAREDLFDLAVRGTIICSLSDPWSWPQGRWSRFVDSCYNNLSRILSEVPEGETDPLWRYYRALQQWYGAASAESLPEDQVRDAITQLDEFEQDWRARSLDEHLDQARRLREAASAALRLPTLEEKGGLAAGGRLTSIPDVIRDAACNAVFRPVVTPLFDDNLRYLFETRRSWQELQRQTRNVQRLIGQLERVRSELQRRQRQVFAPVHEAAALSHAYEMEIKDLDDALGELQTCAVFDLTLLNEAVELHDDVDLFVEIVNVGIVDATEVRVGLSPSKGMRSTGLATHELPAIAAGASGRVQFKLCAEDVEAEVRVELAFRDTRGHLRHHTGAKRLDVRQTKPGPYRDKVHRYQFGPPIDRPEYFYGRREELRNILSRLVAGMNESVLLGAPRRMGKTSLMRMVASSLQNADARRRFEIPLEWEEALQHVHPVNLSFHAFVGDVHVHPQIFFRAYVEELARACRFPLPAMQALMADYEARAGKVGAVMATIEAMKSIRETCPGERVVVLLDEFDEVYQPGSSGLDRNLREVVQNSGGLTCWIVASTMGLLKEVGSISSPFFNIFGIEELNRFPRDVARALITELAAPEAVWTDPAVLALLDLTGCHPAYTQLFCAKMMQHLNRRKKDVVLSDDVETVADGIISEQETAQRYFESYWTETPGMGQLIMFILNRSRAPLKRDEIRRSVAGWVEHELDPAAHRRVLFGREGVIEWWDREYRSGIEYVERALGWMAPDAQRRYAFSIPLFGRWLTRRATDRDLTQDIYEKIYSEMMKDAPR